MAIMCNIRVSDFSSKEVINICDGARYGNVTDIIFDTQTGQIVSVIVPARREGMGFFERSFEYEIPWNEIERVGDDYIFVKFQIPPKSIAPKRRSFF